MHAQSFLLSRATSIDNIKQGYQYFSGNLNVQWVEATVRTYNEVGKKLDSRPIRSQLSIGSEQKTAFNAKKTAFNATFSLNQLKAGL